MSDDDIDHIRKELHEIKTRVSAIETRLAGQPSSKDSVENVHHKRSAYKVKTRKPKTELQAGTLLAVVGGLCFLLAAVFIIKLAVESGWLTPIRQLSIAALLGSSFILAGFWLSGRDKFYFSFLPGIGVVVLFATVYGGALYHKVISLELAMGISVLISAFCIYLYSYLKQSFYVFAAVLGTYLAPILLGNLHHLRFEKMGFYLIWDIVFVLLSIGLRSRLMMLLAAYLALFSYAVGWSNPGFDAAWFQFVQFLIFLVGIIGFTLKSKRALSVQEAWSFGPVVVFFYAIEYYILESLIPVATPYLGLGFAGLIMAGYYIAKAKLGEERLNSEPLVLSVVSLIFFHSFYIVILPNAYEGWFSLLAFAALPFLLKRSRLLPVTILCGAIVGLNFVAIWPLSGIKGLEAIILGSVYSLAILVFYLYHSKQKAERQPFGTLMLLAGSLQAFVALYRIAGEISHGSSGYIATLFWSLWSLGLLLWAKKSKDRLLAKVSVALLLFTAAKGLLYDVSETNPVLRIVCFLLLGGVLYFAGYIFRQIKSWN